MTIRITCPGCQTELTLADTLRGKKVRCKSCDKVIGIPAASKKKVLAAGADVDDEAAIQEEPKLQVKAKSQAPEDDTEADGDEDQPKKKKKKKKKGKQGSMALIIGAVSVVVVLLLVGGTVGAVLMLKSDNQQKKNQLAQGEGKKKDAVDAGNGNPNANGNGKDVKVVVPPVQPQGNNGGIRFVPKIQDGNPATKKGGDNIISNVRGAGYRTERRSELKQIGIAFNQYADEFKGASRNDQTWLDYIKTFGPIREAVKDGYYKMNYNARLEGASVIAYERDLDKGAHLCVRGDGSVDYVPLAELKTILGRDP